MAARRLEQPAARVEDEDLGAGGRGVRGRRHHLDPAVAVQVGGGEPTGLRRLAAARRGRRPPVLEGRPPPRSSYAATVPSLPATTMSGTPSPSRSATTDGARHGPHWPAPAEQASPRVEHERGVERRDDLQPSVSVEVDEAGEENHPVSPVSMFRTSFGSRTRSCRPRRRTMPVRQVPLARLGADGSGCAGYERGGHEQREASDDETVRLHPLDPTDLEWAQSGRRVGAGWAQQGSNLRHLACKASALPLSYAPLFPCWTAHRLGQPVSPRRPRLRRSRAARR